MEEPREYEARGFVTSEKDLEALDAAQVWRDQDVVHVEIRIGEKKVDLELSLHGAEQLSKWLAAAAKANA